MRARDWSGILVATALLAGCGRGEDSAPTVIQTPASQSSASAPGVAPVKGDALAPATESNVGGVVVLGDSLAAVQTGQGVEDTQNWATQLAAQNKIPVINLSSAGESTSHASSMLGSALSRFKPKVLVVAVGGDDGINGLKIVDIEEGLNRLLLEAKTANVKVILVARSLPLNYGTDYRKAFDEIFVKQAARHKVTLVKDVLPADKAELVQKDLRSPTAAAQPLILKLVSPAVVSALK